MFRTARSADQLEHALYDFAEFEGHARPAVQRRDRVGRHIVERGLDRRSTPTR